MAEPSATLTELDDGRTIEATVGDTIELRLPENATTGYRWAFDGLDGHVVRAGEGELIGKPAKVGSGGDVRWRLTALTAATTEVKLKLWRRWEGDRSIQKRFAIRLTIKA
jgi:inhibitor of cysteine peptidase